MALNQLSLSVTTGLPGYPFRSKIAGLTAGTLVRLQNLNGTGFGEVNGFLVNSSLPANGGAVRLTERVDATGETRISDVEITPIAAAAAIANAVAQLSVGRTKKRANLVGLVQVDGSTAWYVDVEDDLGSLTRVAAGSGGGGGGGGVGTALSAPTLTRTSSATTYPPLVDFNRPIDWIDGDQAVMQRSQDPTFATGVSEAVQTILAATTTYNFGLSSIASGSWFMRMAAWRGARPADIAQNWSNITNVGDVTAPTITSSATQSAMSFTCTASEPVVWSIIGGAQQTLWQINASTGVVTAINGASVDVNTLVVQATDYAGNFTQQTITNTLDATPTAFTFTDQTGAALNTVYTSNVITLAGLGTGVAAAISVASGTYAKSTDGGSTWSAFTSSPGTGVNGDQFKVRATSPATSGANLNVVFTAGTVSDTYSITTLGLAWATTNGFNKGTDSAVSGTPPLTVTESGSAQTGVRASSVIVPDKWHLELTLNAVVDPFLFLAFDNATNDFTSALALSNPYNFPNANIIQLNWNAGNRTVGYINNAGSITVGFADGDTASWVNGDILILEGQRSTQTMSAWRSRGGVLTSHGSGTGFRNLTNWYPVLVGKNNTATLNAGSSPFAVTPTSGYSAADGS